MSNHKNLVFFNKEGDYLNFNYNNNSDRFEGDILFHENSTDTYKTFGLYTMENIPSFEYELPGALTTDKFQLFNEYGLNLYGNGYKDEIIKNINPVNNDPEFYSKWIYGNNFESKFPKGSLIKFNQTILEFIDLNKTYTVVGSKKNAIMIISQMDNATFESNFNSIYNDTSFYNGISISGVNAVGVHNYIDSNYNNILSNWSEPDFYDKYYVGKKLNIVNSHNNDGVVTIKNIDLLDKTHFEFSTSITDLPPNSDLIIEVITKTDLPKIYEGPINITNDGRLEISDNFPLMIKPGSEFKIVGSSNNQNFLTVSPIPSFFGNTQMTFYATQSQVIHNNKVYECIQSYTQSFDNTSSNTSFISPSNNTSNWKLSKYIKVNESTTSESLLSGQLYLTTDRQYFEQGWTSSNGVTLASAAKKYKEELDLFGVILSYSDGHLKADLKYTGDYTKVNFYHTNLGTTYSIGSELQTSERLVEINEVVKKEQNLDISENFKYNIIFTDIDEYGIKVNINGMVYDEEVAFIFSGGSIDMERTIDRTIRNWLSRWHVPLITLGIIAELKYTGNYNSVFFNSILLRSEYPNVPLLIDGVEVGTTAEYFIEHSTVLFTDMGPFLTIKINDIEYTQQTIYDSFGNPNISDTLSNWMDTHSVILESNQIFIKQINNLLRFDIKSLDRRLDYSIKTGKVDLPGLSDFKRVDKIVGNHGMLIASNMVKLPTGTSQSFVDVGFATGMVFSINNTYHPWVNQEFNIQFLDPEVMDLSYQGPFWGLTDSLCNSSAFTTIAFSNGFGQTGCGPSISPTQSGGGMFGGNTSGYDPGLGPTGQGSFNPAMFNLSYNLNTYTINHYDLNTFPGTTGLVDIKYIQLSNSIYAFGDELVVIDAFTSAYKETIMLGATANSIEMEYNPINNYLYCLTEYEMFIVDPLLNIEVASIGLTGNGKAFDMEINLSNGDVYVTFDNTYRVWSSSNLTNPPTYTGTQSSSTEKMVFNEHENNIYMTTDSGDVLRISGQTREISYTYSVTGLDHFIFYEPVNESIYAFGDDICKINGLSQSDISISTQTFNDMIFNNLTGEMNISNSTNDFTRLDIDTNSFSQGGIGDHGYLMINQFDGDVYLSSQTLNKIYVIDGIDGTVKFSAPMGSQTTKVVYNPERKSIWTIQPSLNSIVEIEVELGGVINLLPPTYSVSGDNLYGTLDPDYIPKESLWLKTKDYIRRPRENFEGDTEVIYYWKWLSDNVEDFFMYDFTGDQLDRTTTGSYSYTGVRPLDNIVLNKYANKDLSKVGLPEYQQTIFDRIEHTLPYIDSSDDISSDVEPLQLFLGFKSKDEGALRSVLQLYKKEEIEFNIISNSSTNITLKTLDINDENKRGEISINEGSSDHFTRRGLKPGQHIVIYIKDKTNKENQYLSNNNGILLKIREVYTKSIIVDFFNIEYDYLEEENTIIEDHPSLGEKTYLDFSIRVLDKEIGRFMTYGQTEEEDIRYKIELGNTGKLIGPDEVFIFKEYDILEGGIDWKYLNMKRKEMMMMRHLIYPYIGAYKSIINAINYFGYNDLQLNEYYKNVDESSENFSKLFKVEIPDIFDNSVEGWTENDFIKNQMPNDNFEGTNEFNLTYDITNKNGDNILLYSIDEVIIKLQGLKYWLKRNIIPLTHKIKDITGKAYFNNGVNIIHKMCDVRNINIKQEMCPITFKLNEAYLLPVNSGSTVYNCVLDFYSIIPNIGSDITPNRNILKKPKAFNGSVLVSPDYYNIKIRTYKTYKEWAPFKIYDIGDKVIYYDKLYESVTSNNKVNNPRKYDDVSTWSHDVIYEDTNIVEYKRDYYVYKTGSTQSSNSPNLNTTNWTKINDWKIIDNKPVQTITEFRRGDDLLPFNFTLDSNLDPFIVIEVTSDNGYGSIYSDRKNYEIRGLKDLTDDSRPVDPIGPFEPITPIYT